LFKSTALQVVQYAQFPNQKFPSIVVSLARETSSGYHPEYAEHDAGKQLEIQSHPDTEVGHK
jgi:hypothetical protein